MKADKYHKSFEVGKLTASLRQAISDNVRTALNEDKAQNDISSALIDDDTTGIGKIICRQKMILAGCFWVTAVFEELNPATHIKWHYRDGDVIQPNQTLCTIESSLRTILAGERSVLNFLQTLSGTATTTNTYVDKIKHSAVLLDTRKTIPGLRIAQKYAVACGGGYNHRRDLSEMILIKDNHIAVYESIDKAVKYMRQSFPNMVIEVEADNLNQVEQICASKADIVMLDNFRPTDIAQAVKLIDKRSLIEVSGNINLQNIFEYAQAGVDFISSGEITKNIDAIDMSLEIC